MRILYVSQNGMLENLGQSQVLPYLRGLGRRGFEIDLLSFELPDVSEDQVVSLESSLRDDGIRWKALQRRRDSRLRVKFAESAVGVGHAMLAAAARRPSIVHCRSYLPTAVGDVVATCAPKAKLLFDCRGMLGEEYVDAGRWSRESTQYKLVQKYERRAFRRAEGVVVLTEALKRWVIDQGWRRATDPLEAIPCCVDLERFTHDSNARQRVRAELGFEDRLVVVYSGSLGSWYREAEQARFAGILKRRSERKIAFLILTPSPHGELEQLLAREGIAPDEIVVRKARPSEMRDYLSAADIGLSFIMSCFSKKGSSPTKVAEYLACGLPVVLNGDIGDQADLAAETDACCVLDSFDDDALGAAAERVIPLANRPLAERIATGRRVAQERFGLETVGVARYERLYRELGQ